MPVLECSHQIALRTGVWYKDRPIVLSFPESWDVATYWPQTPSPLSDSEIRHRLARPVGQPPLRQLAQGRQRPLIIVDDLSRPTPIFRVMPFVLEEFLAAGIQPSAVRVLVATGTHGEQDRHALANKLGRAAVQDCQLLIHDDTRRMPLVGRTSFGTPVHPNREVTTSDLVVGIGGVYPQHSTGFGGGAKLALGVMERRTIRHLHFRHGSVGGTYNIDNDFRRDLAEVARLIRLQTSVTVHSDAALDIVNLFCGDHEAYYKEAAAFSRSRYDAPPPTDADVVVANAYPFDTSYTFMRKGLKAIRCAPPDATRIVVASNHEGLGEHGLFQPGLSGRIDAYRDLYNRVRTMDSATVARKILRRVGRIGKGSTNTVPPQVPRAVAPSAGPVLLYRPPGADNAMPPLAGITLTSDWDAVIERTLQEQAGKRRIRVRIYPCSPLQCIDAPESESDDGSHGD